MSPVSWGIEKEEYLSRLRAYLDTCLVSAQVKNDLLPSEQSALDAICRAHESGEVHLVCSSVVEDELAKIPSDYRGPHLETLSVFSTVPKVSVGGLTRLSAMDPTANPRRRLWRELMSILPDENDGWDVFVTATNRIQYFVTVDQRTILSRRDAVLRVSGVHALRPSEFDQLMKSSSI